jgi:hypothetical protein
MNNKMGYLLITIGVVIFLWGLSLVLKPSKTGKPAQVLVQPDKGNEITKQDNFDENKAKGDAFEKFVVKNFDTRYFTLQEWRSDKYVDGIYPVSNHFPDLEVIFDFKSKGIRQLFAIECKWRKNYFNNRIEWASDYQLKNYKDYADTIKIPVFVVIGVAGDPEKPQELFIVPLQKMENCFISKSELMKYRKNLDDSRFYWDYDQFELR